MALLRATFVAAQLINILIATSVAQDFGNISDFAAPASAGIPVPLRVYAVPVGQGDCTFIQCPNGNVVVFDCGSSGGNRLTANEIESWLGNAINRVVAILISHPDQDHYNYLPQIQWDTRGIRAVIIGGKSLGAYQSIANWLNMWIGASKLYTIGTSQSSPQSPCIGNCFVNADMDFCNDQNIQFNILAANVGSTSNQQSIVMKITVGQSWSMLLSGDVEGSASSTIARQLGSGLQSVVYKMSHHGASTSANMIGWLNPIQPRSAFASSGYNFGRCRHPRCVTRDRLRSLNTIITTTPHLFYCGNGPGVNPTIDNNYQYSMFQTSPAADIICLLIYASSNVEPQSLCERRIASQFQRLADDDSTFDGDCDDDEDTDAVASTIGGTLSTAASSIVLTVATLLLCSIILTF